MEYVCGFTCGPPAHRLHKTGAIQIVMEGSDPPDEGYVYFLISTVTGRMDGGDSIGRWGRQCWDTGTAAAIAAPH
jgi:hypothetical protein